jgi:hypothetical protein
MAYTENKQVPGLDQLTGSLDGTEQLIAYRADQPNGLTRVALSDVADFCGKEASEPVTPIYQFSTARRLITGTAKVGEVYRADGSSANFTFDANGYADTAGITSFLGVQSGYWGVITNNAAGQVDFFRPSSADAIANSPRFNAAGFNGRPSMDFYAAGKSLYDRSAAQIEATNITAQLVFKPGSTTNSQALFWMQGASDAQSLAFSHNGATNGRIGIYQNGAWQYTGTPASNGAQVLSFICSTTDGVTVLVNGQIIATGLTYSPSAFYSALQIGNTFSAVGPFTGLIAEVRLWSGAMAVSTMQRLDAESMSFYRIDNAGGLYKATAGDSDLVMVRDAATGVLNEVPASALPGGGGGGGAFDSSVDTALNGLFGSTVNLTVDELIGDRLLPEQFDAVGDGVTDDTAALNRWAQACITHNKTAALYPGSKYLITDTVKFLNAQGLKVEGHPTSWIMSDFFPAGYDLSQDKGGNILFLSTTSQTLKAGGNKTLDESNGTLDNLNAGIYSNYLQVKGASYFGHTQSLSGQAIAADGFGKFRDNGRFCRFVNPQEIFTQTYATGTITATQNSTTITGSGTTFTGNVNVGDIIRIAGDNRDYIVRSVNSNTSLTLAIPVKRSTASGLSYQIGYTGVVYRLYESTGAGTAGNRPVKGTGAGLLMGSVPVSYLNDVTWKGGYRSGTAYVANDYITRGFGDLYICRNAGTASNEPSESSDVNCRIQSTLRIEKKVQVGKATITNDGPGGVGRVVLTGSPSLLTAAQAGNYVRFGYTGSPSDRVTVSGTTVTTAFSASTAFSTAGNASIGDQVRFADDDTAYTIASIASPTQFTLSSAPPVASAVTFNVRGSNKVWQIQSITSNNEFILTAAYDGQLTSDVHCTIGNVVWEFMGDGLRDGDDGVCTFGGTRVVHENFTTVNFLDSHLRTPRSTTVPNSTRFEALASHNVRYRNGNIIGGASPHSTTNGGTCDHVLENCYISTNLATKSASRQPNSERMIWDNLNIRHLSNYPAIEIQGYSNSRKSAIITSVQPNNPGDALNIVTNGGATYTTGTVSFTNGSPIVVGSSTSWLQGGPAAGDTLRLGSSGPLYTIASVDSDSQITLTTPYQEGTATGQSYRIYRRAFDMRNKYHDYTVKDFSRVVGYTITNFYKSVNETFKLQVENYDRVLDITTGANSTVEGFIIPSGSSGRGWLGKSRANGGTMAGFVGKGIYKDCSIDLTNFDGTFYWSFPLSINPYESTGNDIRIPIDVDFLTASSDSGGRPLTGNQVFIPAGMHAIHRRPQFGQVKRWSTIRGGSSDTDKWNVGTASVTNGSTTVNLSSMTGVASNSIAVNDYIRIQGVDQPILVTAVTIDTGALTAVVTLASPWTGSTGSGLLFHVNPAWQWRATEINGTEWRQTKTGNYTLTNWDSGSILVFDSGSAVTVTLPATIADGTVFRWVQKGTGQITFSPGAGATLVNISSHTKSVGQNAEGMLRVSNNFNNTAAAFKLTGETAA